MVEMAYDFCLLNIQKQVTKEYVYCVIRYLFHYCTPQQIL